MIIESYYKAWRKGGTFKKRDSILQQFTWLISLMKEIKKEVDSKPKAAGKKETYPLSDRIENSVSSLQSVKVALQARLSD